MLHLFLTDYFLREQSYQRYEFFNYELAKWAEFYLKQYAAVHQSNWCAGKVTENPDDILLGHPTWDSAEQTRQLGMGKLLRDWVKDNALDPSQPCHPNTYIVMPWVPEFPNEWMPNLIHLESQLLSARKIFALCGNVWFERTLAKQDKSIQARVKHKLIKVNIGIALDNFPIRKNKFNPIGSRQLLHISTLGSYKGFDITCESIQGLNAQLNVASKSLEAPIGLIDAKWTNGKTYTFNFLGSVNNNDPQFNQWVVDTCDFYIHTGTMDAQATVILENCARGLIPLVTPESGFDCPHAIYLTFDSEKNKEIIQAALHMPSEELLERSYLIREYLKVEHSWQKTFDTIWQEIQKDIYQRQLKAIQISDNDYVSPNLEVINIDQYFPNLIIGDRSKCSWRYLRREIPHNWYVDREFPMVGLLNRDEAHILYNSALQFCGKKALEIGCWVGWSTVHLALAGVRLDVVDPMLDHPIIGNRVRASLKLANLENNVVLHTGFSPDKVAGLYHQTQQKWSLIFIDGDHTHPAPLKDAVFADQFAEEDALILFHDLACPDVAEGLSYLRAKGWQVMIYQTMQIMGVAWRGKVAPIQHTPDPKIKWQLPSHLQGYVVSGTAMTLERNHLPSKSITGFYPLVSALRYTNKLPFISVIIPCFNQGNFLAEAVASVVCQTYEHWEIIIVNDGSSDNTSEIAKQLIALYPDASISLVEQANSGTASARNHGIRLAKGEYILPLDADDRLTNYAIEALLENALQCGKTCVSFGSFRTFNSSSMLTVSVDLYRPSDIANQNMLSPCCLISKSIWEHVGGYKEDMRHGNEDWEFWVNCHRHKIKFVGIPELVLQYRRYQGSRHEQAQDKFLYLLSQMVVHNPEMYAPEMVRTAQEVLQQNQPELPFTISANTLISFPDWDTFPEAIYEQLQDALLQIFQRSDSGKFTLLLITDHDASVRADEILSEAVVNLLLRPEVDFQQEPQIHLVIASDLDQRQWNYLLSILCGRVALECENQGLVRELNADRLPVWEGATL